MGATGGYRAPRAGLLLRHPVQGDRPSDAVLDDRRALDRSNQTHSYVKDVQGQNVRHVLGLDTLTTKGAASTPTLMQDRCRQLVPVPALRSFARLRRTQDDEALKAR